MKITPHISEKAFSGAEKGVYTFRVPKSAPKLAIQREVEQIYNVSVTRIATSTVPPKQRRRGRIQGVRPGYKKAIVTLKEGQKITELEG